MFVADVKCSQATWQTVPNSQTGSAKASVSEAVRTWHRTHVIRGRPKGSSVSFGDEMDIISQVRRHLTAQWLAHQTGEFELHSPLNRKPVQLTQHRRNVVMTFGSGDEACCSILQRLDCPHDVLSHSIQKRIAVVQMARYECLNQCLGSLRSEWQDEWA